MNKENENSKSIIEQIYEETFKRLRKTLLFNETTLEELQILANNGELKYEKKVIAVIQSEERMDYENSRA